MACGGCHNRQIALERMVKAAREAQMGKMIKMGKYVFASAGRDIRRVAQSSLAKTRRR